MAIKTLLLASALAFGGTAIAQSTTQTTPATPPPAEGMATPQTDPNATMTPPSAPQTQTPTTAPMSQSQMPSTTQGMPTAGTPAADGATPMGGYQPANPPMQGTPQPGQQVVFQPSQSPSQAYPPPAPLESYPICKKGQTDKCRQRGG